MSSKFFHRLEHDYKVLRWHSKHNIRKVLRKILYGMEYYKDPYAPSSGVYKVATTQINDIYSFKGKYNFQKKIPRTNFGSWLLKIKENYFNLEIQPLRKLDRGMIYKAEESLEENSIKLEKTTFFISAKKRFFENIPWEKTPYWNFFLSETGKTKEEALKSLSAWEKIYFDIQKRGYLPQSKICSGICSYCKYRSAEVGKCIRCGKNIIKENLIKNHAHSLSLSEIAVHIGEAGKLYLSQGRHRITYARLLNIEKVYVNIIIRHERWVDFREKIVGIAQANNGKITYPLDHIDLINIPHIYKEEYFSKVYSSIGEIEGPLLELNSSWSFFSKKFGDLGFECFVHIDISNNLEFCNKLKLAQGGRYKLLEENINQFIINKNPFYVLMVTDNLNSILVSKKKLNDLLNRIEIAKPKVLILNIENPNKSKSQEIVDIQSVEKTFIDGLNFPNKEFINCGDFTTLILKKREKTNYKDD